MGKAEYKGVVIVLGLAAVCAASNLVYAAGDPREMGKYGDEVVDRVVSELNLTAEQRNEVKYESGRHAVKSKELQKALSDKRNELKAELEKPDTDKNAVDRIAQEVAQLQGQIVDERINSILIFKEILTPQQYETFYQRTKEAGERVR